MLKDTDFDFDIAIFLRLQYIKKIDFMDKQPDKPCRHLDSYRYLNCNVDTHEISVMFGLYQHFFIFEVNFLHIRKRSLTYKKEG